MSYTYIFKTWEAKIGGLGLQSKSGLHSQKKIKFNKTYEHIL